MYVTQLLYNKHQGQTHILYGSIYISLGQRESIETIQGVLFVLGVPGLEMLQKIDQE